MKKFRRETKYLIRAKFNGYVQKLTSSASGLNKNKIWSFFKAKTSKGSIPASVVHDGKSYLLLLIKQKLLITSLLPLFSNQVCRLLYLPYILLLPPSYQTFNLLYLKFYRICLLWMFPNQLDLMVYQRTSSESVLCRLLHP